MDFEIFQTVLKLHQLSMCSLRSVCEPGPTTLIRKKDLPFLDCWSGDYHSVSPHNISQNITKLSPPPPPQNVFKHAIKINTDIQDNFPFFQKQLAAPCIMNDSPFPLKHVSLLFLDIDHRL